MSATPTLQDRDLNDGWTLSHVDGRVETVDLPHDAMLGEPRSAEVRNGTRTGWFPGGRYQYARDIEIAEHELGAYVAVRFEGVYHRSVVSVNGRELARHAYGYDEFEVDLSEVVVVGRNRIEVAVDTSREPNSRWYTGSGIYRPVTLVVRDRRRITDLRVTTRSLTPPTVAVEASAPDDATVHIFDGAELLAEGPLGEFTLDGAGLWSAESPRLYRAEVHTSADRVETSFGIRTIDVSGSGGFRVNGVETKLRGACIHHDNGILGARAYADAEARKVRILKESGYNAIRSAHNPCSRALLDACDRYGMYVIDEAFDGWYTPKSHHDFSREFRDEHVGVLESLVAKDRNHPSVVMYSIGNEVTEPAEPDGVALAGEMADRVRALDPTRPVTCGVNLMLIGFDMGAKEDGPYDPDGHATGKDPHDQSAGLEKASGSTLYNLLVGRIGTIMSLAVKGRRMGRKIEGLAAHLDVVGYNYAEARYDADAKRYPERVVVGSETMAARLPFNWARVQRHTQVIGDFVWTGWDYLGEIGLGYWRYPSESGLQVAYGGGTIDLIGNRDAQNHYQQVVWGIRTEPWIGVRPLTHAGERVVRSPWRMTDAVGSWTWPGCEGARAEMEVYADARVVRLELDGRPIGRSRVRNRIARFRTAYRPGRLEAIAEDRRGRVVGRTTLSTAGEARLHARPDTIALRPNGQDLSFVEIALADDAGTVHAAGDREVTVEIEGDAVALAAVGSANPRPATLYGGPATTTWYGRALAVLRAGHRPGEATVTVRAEGLDDVSFRVTVEPVGEPAPAASVVPAPAARFAG
ncbi:glycoside hydrolase family 2 TIM barrel-domain containing protein [Agromyces mangrovi Wang et al. 2018]|uniref:glycoside hydrolase family 2 TIM barrel-domain containing protein n=1 Tax=Agromyces mangrovi TaxID=1858653 RepID=UPI002572D473|nr:glycoside hydrolase family 2 TIM barrel-domain containing protein [Agromyces mangrovi]BDZ64680.1 hypothetical protein GCM10025877_16180 [Agromyces mangrovi]